MPRKTQWGSCISLRFSPVATAFIGIDYKYFWIRLSASGRCPPELVEICHREFQCHVGKTNSRKKPGAFQAFSAFGDFTSELETAVPVDRMLKRAKYPAAKLPAWDVLQGKAHFEKRIVSRLPCSPSARTNSRKGWRWQRNRSLADAPLVNDRRRCASDRSVRAEGQCSLVSHRFPCGLFRPMGHWRSYDKIIESAPFGERNWKAPNNALKNVMPVRRASSRVSLVRMQEWRKAIAGAGPGDRRFHIRLNRLTGFSKIRARFQHLRFPKSAFGRAPRRIGLRDRRQSLGRSRDGLDVSSKEFFMKF